MMSKLLRYAIILFPFLLASSIIPTLEEWIKLKYLYRISDVVGGIGEVIFYVIVYSLFFIIWYFILIGICKMKWRFFRG